MGSSLIINDTLEITAEQGFPADELILETHKRNPYKANDFAEKVFEFRDKLGPRRYHTPPTRNFFAHNIHGKWLYWGKILVIEQTISGENEETLTTSGKYRIIEIFEPDFQEQFTIHNSPPGKSYF